MGRHVYPGSAPDCCMDTGARLLCKPVCSQPLPSQAQLLLDADTYTDSQSVPQRWKMCRHKMHQAATLTWALGPCLGTNPMLAFITIQGQVFANTSQEHGS